LFRAPATDEELAAVGFIREDVAAQETCEVLEENWPAVMLFLDLMTQWRMGMAGPVGIDYAVLPVVMDLRHVAITERSQMFDDIRIMESAALAAIRGKK
jgi:hypothetical protein